MIQMVEESRRGYKKAPEGRRDKRKRVLSAIQDDPGPTCFNPPLFLNNFSLPHPRKTEAIPPDLPRNV